MKLMTSRRRISALWAFLVVLSAATSPAAEPPEVKALFYRAMRGGKYVQAEAAEVRRSEALFYRLFTGDRSRDLFKAWSEIGFRLVKSRHSGVIFRAVMENKKRKTGRGFFIFAESVRSKTALMTPHGFRDLDTDMIGLALALEGPLNSAAWNTVPRYPKGLKGDVHQDLTVVTSSYFTAYTRAFARAFPKGRLIQVHGFARSNLKTQTMAPPDMIISAGRRTPPPGLLTLGACLRSVIPSVVLIYPIGIKELGATTNVSGRILRKMGHSGFVHLEMSRPLRKRLLSQTELRRSLLECLEQ